MLPSWHSIPFAAHPALLTLLPSSCISGYLFSLLVHSIYVDCTGKLFLRYISHYAFNSPFLPWWCTMQCKVRNILGEVRRKGPLQVWCVGHPPLLVTLSNFYSFFILIGSSLAFSRVNIFPSPFLLVVKRSIDVDDRNIFIHIYSNGIKDKSCWRLHSSIIIPVRVV